jgi:hypothetical protein
MIRLTSADRSALVVNEHFRRAEGTVTISRTTVYQDAADALMGGPVGQIGGIAPAEKIGQAGLVGWRAKVAEQVAPAAAKRGPLSENQARALVGGLFFALSVYYVAVPAAL